jgi:hypothetical protein
VVVESAVADGVVRILTMRIRCTDDTGYRFVDRGQHEAVAEALGIMEALGQKEPDLEGPTINPTMPLNLRAKLGEWHAQLSRDIVADIFPSEDYKQGCIATAHRVRKILGVL